MEVQLEDLIKRIKDEGIRSADEKGEAIIREAEQKASAIIEKARKDASELSRKAEADAARMEATGREALKQAARDTLISLRSEIVGMLDNLLKTETGKALRGESLKDAIVSVVRNWKPDQTGMMNIVIPAAEASALESSLRSALAEEMKKGMEIKPSPELKAGFRISAKNGEWFYDFTDEELSAVLTGHLSASLAKILAG
jgi:V/A-type H+-transporting ATPase subunit E